MFGGLLTLLAYGLLLLAGAYYVLNFLSFSNVVPTTFLSYIDSDPVSGTFKKYETFPALSTVAVPSLPSFTGLRVRILAQGEPNRCSLPLKYSPGWNLEATSGALGGGVAADNTTTPHPISIRISPNPLFLKT